MAGKKKNKNQKRRPISASQNKKQPAKNSRHSINSTKTSTDARSAQVNSSAIGGYTAQNGKDTAQKKPHTPVSRSARKAAKKAARQKQSAPKRKKFHGGNYILYYLLAGIIIAAVLIILSNTVLFRCTEIVVNDCEHYADNEVIAASEISLGDNLLRTDTNEAGLKIVNALAYVDEADVKKSFPAKVIINVTEAEKQFCVIEGSVSVAVSCGGKIIEICQPENLPIVKGYEAESLEPGKRLKSKVEDKTEIPQMIFSSAEAAELKKITEIDVTDKFNVKVTIDNRVILELGPMTDVNSKLKVAQKIISEQLGEDEYVTLLLTNPERVPSITNTPPTVSSSSSSTGEQDVSQPDNTEDDLNTPDDDNEGEYIADYSPTDDYNQDWEDTDDTAQNDYNWEDTDDAAQGDDYNYDGNDDYAAYDANEENPDYAAPDDGGNGEEPADTAALDDGGDGEVPADTAPDDTPLAEGITAGNMLDDGNA